MDTLHSCLRKLDELYHADTLTEYEQFWQRVEQQVQQDFPGFTLSFAEIYNAGIKRTAHGGMRHVLMPIQMGEESETV